MLIDTLLKACAASLALCAPVLAEGEVDQAKVQKYKALFAEQDHHIPSGVTSDPPTKTFDPSVFESAFKWADVVHGAWWFSGCQPSCQACPAGCNLACCVRHPLPWPPPPSPAPPSKSPSGKPSPSPSPTPKSPLSCPCTCGPGCPAAVQAVCCSTPGSKDDHDGNDDGRTLPELNKLHPLICPCHCEASCPAWIQAICCDTPGSGGVRGKTTPSLDAGAGAGSQMGLVMQNAAGEPVAVLAATNLTIEQSFITTDLVRGLGRADEVQQDDRNDIFQIVLDVIVGPEGAKGVLKQSFQVIDGSRLLEQAQILLGVKFMARIDGLSVKQAYLTGLEGGLRIEAGERPGVTTGQEGTGHDEL